MIKRVEVTITVDVELDETKFTPEFMAEYDRYISPLTLDGHFKNLAWNEATGRIGWSDSVIEGYGKLSEMGIRTTTIGEDSEIVN